jgi:2'-5' RNA ligase
MNRQGRHPNRLQNHYDRMWLATIGKIRKGDVEIDPLLAARQADLRRGLTVIARPSPAVRQRVAAFLDQLRRLEPEQYYYAPSELHVTILGLFTATVRAQRFLARTGSFVSAVDSALRAATPIRIEFFGVTASPGAILVQGFFEDGALNGLRDVLRRELETHGLSDGGVDERYRLETAHMTAVRFRAPLRDGVRFAAAIKDARKLVFGHTEVRSVSLVKNDWYMSRKVLETVKRYRFSRAIRRGEG